MNKISSMRPTGRLLRALMVAGIALSIVGGSSALAQAQRPARSADANTAHACASAQTILSRGSTGDCVYIAQKMLYDAGFRGTPLDGIFGSVTQQIVREYQKSAGLKSDGIIGYNTWIALIRASGY